MSLARFLMALRARWRLALSVLLAVLGLTLAVSLLLPTRYTATAMVLVDARAADPVAPGGAQPPQASTYMAMQVDLIQSERVARAVIAATGLGRADGPARAKWQEETGGAGDFEAWLAAAMRKRLEVRPAKESGVISIAYTADSREEAARIANAFVQAFVDTSLALRLDPARGSSAFFDERARQLRAALEEAQQRLSAFQREHGLLAVGSDERVDIDRLKARALGQDEGDVTTLDE